ncbi:MAG: hypothetical protein R2831_07600 [Chitinophagaceae bacterium]
MKTYLLICSLFLASHAIAQLPTTNIYLLTFQKQGKKYLVQNPQKINKKKGYNNQPYFSPDGDGIYYTSSIDTSNTELFFYKFKNKKSKRLTRTKEPEYSPKFTPDMENISCVRVEKDKTTQHFYIYNKRGKKPICILPDLKSIGYYEWIKQNEFLSFELPEPFYLVKHNLSSHHADTLATHIGRTFYYLKTKNLASYVDKSDSNKWYIKTISGKQLAQSNSLPQQEYETLAETLPHEEDYCFLQNGSILMGHDGKLYILSNPFRNNQNTWQEIADLSKLGIHKFYRISISNDNTKIAIVAYEGDKP